jgi:hypothetical protein
MLIFDYSTLVAELDNWPADGLPATFWWRDDDAAEPCDELDRLLDVAEGRPLALAAVPFFATAALAERLADERHVTIFQHGWKHQNHSADAPNSEYPAGRDEDAVARELSDGSAKLKRLFGDQFAPIFTPPWHGLHLGYLPLLKAAGFRGLSGKGRRSAPVDCGLIQNNIHCVPIQWSDPPGLGDPARHIGQLVGHLKQRRGGSDPDETTGILTHHLVQTRESLQFIRGVIEVISAHPRARLMDPGEVFFGSSGRIIERRFHDGSQLADTPFHNRIIKSSGR